MHWQCAYLVLWVCLNWVYTVVGLENNNNLLLHVVDLCLWQCIVFFSCTLPYLCYTILLLLLCWFVLYQYCCHNLIHGAVSFTTTTPGCYNSGCLPATYIYIYTVLLLCFLRCPWCGNVAGINHHVLLPATTWSTHFTAVVCDRKLALMLYSRYSVCV